MVGLVLLAPAVVAMVITYLIPAISQVEMSFQKVDPFRDTAEGVGSLNYEAVEKSGFWGRIGFAFSLAVVPIAVFLLVGPVLAWLADRSGRPGRWTARIAATVPLVVVSPIVFAVAWYLNEPREALVNPANNEGLLRSAYWAVTAGLVCSVATVVFLAVVRRRPGRPSWLAGVAVSVVAVTGLLALALQDFSFGSVYVSRTSPTPMSTIVEFSFLRFQMGVGAAAGTLLVALVAVLGLIATLVIVTTGLRLEDDAGEPGPPPPPQLVPFGLGLTGTIVLAGAILGALLFALWPVLNPAESPFGSSGFDAEAAGAPWVSALVVTARGLVLALLAGFGIGALRPFGRYSELLLLPFAPWLFLGLGPMITTQYLDLTRDGRLAEDALPPIWLNVPALFVFTLLFKGQRRYWDRMRAAGWDAGRTFWRAYGRPGLPVAGVAAVLTVVYSLQDVLWPYLVYREEFPPTLLLYLVSRENPVMADSLFWTVLNPAVLVVAFLLLAAAQVLFLDRIAIRAGRTPAIHAEPLPAPPPPPGWPAQSGWLPPTPQPQYGWPPPPAP